MIKNDVELVATKERIIRFWRMVDSIRKGETNSASYQASAGGFLAEIDKMTREVSEYLSLHPSEFEKEQERVVA